MVDIKGGHYSHKFRHVLEEVRASILPSTVGSLFLLGDSEASAAAHFHDEGTTAAADVGGS